MPGCFEQGLNGSVLVWCNDSSHFHGDVTSAREARRGFDARVEWSEALYSFPENDVEPVFNGYGR